MSRRPQLEPLERRDVLASYFVSTAEDMILVATDAYTAYPVMVTPPAYGSVTFRPITLDNEMGGFVYIPAANYFGSDKFSYTTNPPPGGLGPSELNDVSITITPVNDAPVAHGDQFPALQNTTLTIDSPGVLKNDTDVDSNALTATVVAMPSHGTLTLKDGGGFVYTPATDYTGPDSFTYKASDGQASSEVATVSLYVAANTVIARENTYLALQNTALNIAAPGVLSNDSGINGRSLTASLEPNTGPQHGTVTLNPDGSFSYVPDTGYVGPDSFVYRATDVSPLANPLPPASATAKVTINVRTPIVANNDTYSTPRNVALSIAKPGVQGNDYFAVPIPGFPSPNNPTFNQPPFTATLISGPPDSTGTVKLNADGSFTFVPAADFVGTATFTYQDSLTIKTSDADDAPTQTFLSNVATVAIRVVNALPEAHADYYSTPQDTALKIDLPGVLGNDKGATGHVLNAKLGDGPSHGTLALNADGSFTYTPTTGYVGPDYFSYRAVDTSVQDPAGGSPTSAPAKVSIYVRSTAPIVIANNDIYTTPPNAPLSIELPGVLKNDYLLSPDASNTTGGGKLDIPLTAKLVTDVNHGTLTLNADGSFQFAPENNYAGPVTFTYQAVMAPPAGTAAPAPSPSSHDIATVTIYVQPLIPKPEARPDYFTVLQDATTTIAAPGVLKNDAPVSNYPLVAMLDKGPSHGTVSLSADGSFTYAPTPGYTGPDYFTYFDTETYVPPTTGDGPVFDPISLHSNTTTVYLSVQPLHPPVYAIDDVYKTLPGTTLTIAAPGVLGNDKLVPPPLPLNPNPTDPATGAISGTATDVQPSPIPIPYPNVTVTATLLTNVAHGKLTLNAEGGFTYTPDANFSGPDTFTYQAKATTNGSTPPPSLTAAMNAATDPSFPCTIGGPCPIPPDDIATVTIYVQAPEPPPGPVATDDTFIAAENADLDINAPGVLRNDYFRGVLSNPADQPILSGATGTTPLPTNPPLSAVLVAGPSSGTLTLNPNGSFHYEPKADFVGIDTFTYQAQVGPTSTNGTFVMSNIATVTIKVVAAIAHGDQYQTPQDTTLNIAKPGVLANDAGGSAAHPLVATPLSNPLHGTLTMSDDGSFQYVPNPGYSGPDLFTYRASDGTTPPGTTPPPTPGTTATATGDSNGSPSNAIDVGIVRIYVRPLLAGIQAHDDKFPAVINTKLDIAAPGVFANDFGPVNVPVVAAVVTDVQHGTLQLNANGSFTYTPTTSFTGEDKFTYSAAPADPTSTLKAGTATVTIYVMASNAMPKVILGGNQTTTDESGPQRVTDWATVVSVGEDGQPCTFTVTTDNRSLFAAPPTIDATGQLVYTPAPNASGDAQITVVTHDESGDTTQNFTIHVDKPHPLYNAVNPLDVNNDKFIAPNDVVAIINYINAHPIGSLDVPAGESGELPYLDVSRDNSIAPIDALMIINALNAGLAGSAGLGGGEGEAAGASSVDAGLLTLVAQDTAEATMGRKRSG